jgi:hypothetical protein
VAFLRADVIWTAIAERITGVNTLGFNGRVMPASGAYALKVDRIDGADPNRQAQRSETMPNASIRILPLPSEDSPSQPGSVSIERIKVTIAISYNLPQEDGPTPRVVYIKSLAQEHANRLKQALGPPGVLHVTQAAGVAADLTVLNAGTATGLMSDCLIASKEGMRVTKDDGPGGLYEIELDFTGQVVVQQAMS